MSLKQEIDQVMLGIHGATTESIKRFSAQVMDALEKLTREGSYNLIYNHNQTYKKIEIKQEADTHRIKPT